MEETSNGRYPFERIKKNGLLTNGQRLDKIQSCSSITNKQYQIGEDQVDSGMDDKYFGTPENNHNGGIFRMKSLGNLSQYERSFGATPKSLMKLKEEFEERRQALLAQRKSLTNLLENSDHDEKSTNGFKNGGKKESIFALKTNSNGVGKYRRKFGVGDTKYIGNDDPPDTKHYQLTKMKSLGTIPDIITERINYDPFLTPLIARRHPISLHSFRSDEQDSNGSSDMEEQEDFLRHQPDEHLRFMNEISLLKGSFERGFRRSYNKKHERTKPTTPLRQSDGYFQKPFLPVKKTQRQSNPESKSQSSVHSLPTDGKLDSSARYEYDIINLLLVHTSLTTFTSEIDKNKNYKENRI